MLQEQDIINRFELSPHPEGGHFKETCRSTEIINHNDLPKRYTGDRSYSTAILFLLQSGEISRLHKIKSDEIWHFHMGDALELTEITANGKVIITTLGTDISKGQVLQYVVPAGNYFGGYTTGAYSLVGCTVTPGFDFADFEFADKDELLKHFPQHSELIKKLTI